MVQIAGHRLDTVQRAVLLQRVVMKESDVHPSLKRYRFALSGHSHRAELALSLMRLPYALVDVDLTKC